MSNQSSPKCQQCGAVLPDNAPAGLCPNCLMALNLKTETVFTDDSAAAQPPLSPAELTPHFPQLEILECLGRGGMGVVYKARQKSLNRLVALKLLAPERVSDAKFAQRFTHEAQALAALNHPSIVTIYDFGQAGGFYFLLMEFVDGVNLRQAMKAGRFTPEQALAIVPPVCEALQYAHEQGIVHRDIKPENLLLDKAGQLKIADFGIAKMLHANSSDVGLAESQPIGTPQYMAPEQKEHGRTDHRADIYSLGVVLYELLTGELPTDKLQPPSRKVQIDVRLDGIVLRALETKPELRYQTAADFRTQVESIAKPPAVRTTTPRSTASSIALAALVFLLGILIPVVGIPIHNSFVRATAADQLKYIKTLQNGTVSLSTQIGEANAVAGRAASRAGNSAEREETRAQAREEQRTYEQRSVNLQADLDRLHAALAAAGNRPVNAHSWRVVFILVTGVLLVVGGGGSLLVVLWRKSRSTATKVLAVRCGVALLFSLLIIGTVFVWLKARRAEQSRAVAFRKQAALQERQRQAEAREDRIARIASPTVNEVLSATGTPAGISDADPNRPLSVTLSNGVTVELVGLSYYPTKGKPWWRPNGEECQPLFDGSGVDIRSLQPAGERTVVCAFAITGLKSGTGSEANFAWPEFAMWGGRQFRNGAFQPEIKAVALNVPTNANLVHLRLTLDSAERFRLEYETRPATSSEPNPVRLPLGEVGVVFLNVSLRPGLRAQPSAVPLRVQQEATEATPEDFPSYQQFDQTPGRGWRALADSKKFVEAANLIRDFLRYAPALSARDRANLHFHAAQCFAFDGQPKSIENALAHLRDARILPEPPDSRIRWNDYVAATEAFLRNDLPALGAARERIAAGPKLDGAPANLDVVDRLVSKFGKPYTEPYPAKAK